MKNGVRLWLSFSIHVIIIMFVIVFVTGTLSFRFFPSDIYSVITRLFPLMPLLIVAILVSAFLILIAPKRLLVPIQNLIEALQRVAEGDLTVWLSENHEDAYTYNMNANFNKVVKELNSMEMFQSGFIQSMSYEFKTPLTSIEGYATLPNGVPLPDELHVYSGHILESARQLSVLTGNILKISKLENQGIAPQKESLFLDEQIRQAPLSLVSMWEPKNLDIDMDLPETLYCGNENLMFQVWTNLSSNAVEFTPPGGSISVHCCQAPEVIQVCTKDTGVGMIPEVQSHIFDKFYQDEQNRSIEGNGLGLALVKKIVTLCNGTAAVESRPDEGFVFTARLLMDK